MTDVERVVDARRRISLRGFGTHTRYRVFEDDHGRILLQPLVSVTTRELAEKGITLS